MQIPASFLSDKPPLSTVTSLSHRTRRGVVFPDLSSLEAAFYDIGGSHEWNRPQYMREDIATIKATGGLHEKHGYEAAGTLFFGTEIDVKILGTVYMLFLYREPLRIKGEDSKYRQHPGTITDMNVHIARQFTRPLCTDHSLVGNITPVEDGWINLDIPAFLNPVFPQKPAIEVSPALVNNRGRALTNIQHENRDMFLEVSIETGGKIQPKQLPLGLHNGRLICGPLTGYRRMVLSFYHKSPTNIPLPSVTPDEDSVIKQETDYLYGILSHTAQPDQTPVSP
ncbi:MAG: hypothetical protein HY362_01015 [Candidatus Aenigmarchaeota archaeon]|nr:hypothetical protein [Candidatus Aenigmarchaeota archaeon]